MRRKESGLSSSTTSTTTQSSGISRIDNLPKILRYPKLLPFFTNDPVSPGDSVKNVLCYIIEHYGNSGISVLIYRDKKTEQIVVICGDWDGNPIDLMDDSYLSRYANKLVTEKIELLMAILKYANIPQAQLYFAIKDDALILVDIQTALNKMASPGMVKDMFSKVCDINKVLKIELVDDRVIEAMKTGGGEYGGDLIIKPTRFRMYESGNNDFIPLYLEVKR